MHQDRMRGRISRVRWGESHVQGEIWPAGFFAVEICRIFQMQA